MAPKAAPVKSGSSRSFDPVKEDDTPKEHIVKNLSLIHIFYYGFNHYLTERGIFIPALAIVILYILLLCILMITDYEHTKFEDGDRHRVFSRNSVGVKFHSEYIRTLSFVFRQSD